MILVGIERFAADLLAVGVAFRGEHLHGFFPQGANTDFIANAGVAQGVAERTLQIHAPNVPVAALGLDAHEVGHGLLRIVLVMRWPMIYQPARDEVVLAQRGLLGALTGLRRCVWLIACAVFPPRGCFATARGRRAHQPFALELGGRVTLDF